MTIFLEQLEKGKEFLVEKDFQSAAQAFAECIQIDPKNNEPYYLLAEIYKDFERYDDALFFLDAALEHCDRDTELSLGYKGLVYINKNELSKAKECLTQALEMAPNTLRFNGLLGNIENSLGNQIKAIQYYLKELSLKERAVVYYDLATSYKNIGEIDKAIECLNACLRLDPENLDAAANLLSFTLYSPKLDNKELKAKAEKYCNKFILDLTKNRRSIFDFSQRKAKAKIRLGIITGDFWSHPSSFFLEGVLKELDRKKFEVYAYDATGDHSDKGRSADHIKSKVDCWEEINTLDPFTAGQLIYDQEIDILLDLSGHTRNNRLDVLTLKPAPIQASWLAYPSTTGLKEIDYLIVDENTVRKGEEDLYTERLYKLGCSQTPFSITVDNIIKDAPYKKNGFITYGCLNNFSKVNHEVLELWSELLKKNLDSKLYLRTFTLDDADLQEKIKRFFELKGINKDRIILEGSDKRENFINNYNKIDIALDVFPYCGATTTVELLMMGVPLISLEGQSWHTRVSSGLMRAVGLDDLIAKDKDEYLEKAIKLAKDKERIDFCRKNLRQLALNSSCNSKNFTKELEKALVNMTRIVA